MGGQGILKLDGVKASNRRTVLLLLRRRASASRVGLRRELGCDGTTITRIIRGLIEEGIVADAGATEATKGRPKELIAMNAQHRLAIGVEIDPQRLLGVVADLKGGVRFRDQVALPPGLGQAGLLESLDALVARLRGHVDERRLLGLAATTYGLRSADSQSIQTATYFPSLEGVNLREHFAQARAPRPLVVDGTFATAFCELWLGDGMERGAAALVSLGMGIGGIIALDGHLVFHRGGYAGEFGHLVIDPAGPRCPCGRRGCVEAFCAIPALESQAGKPFAELVGHYRRGEAQAVALVDASAERLGLALGNLVNLILPGKITLSGELLELGDAYFAKVEAATRRVAFPVLAADTTLCRSAFGDEAPALGAAMLLVRDFLEGDAPE